MSIKRYINYVQLKFILTQKGLIYKKNYWPIRVNYIYILLYYIY